MADIPPDLKTLVPIWRNDPVRFVRDIFHVEPDEWQKDALIAYLTSPRIAMKSAAGVGKSTILAWLGWHMLFSYPLSWIGVTSITGDNLKSGLWTEIGRWYNVSPLLNHFFEMTKTEVYAKEAPQTWKMEARSWAKDADANSIGNALRGPHAKYIMWLLDETGSYPNSILPVCENIFSGSPAKAHIIQAGNPSNLDGPLYRACTTSKNLWFVVEITADPDNPKRSPRVSVEHARAQIEQYGRDNPWVQINILGQFPPSSLNSLIGPDEVREAMKRMYRDYDFRDNAKIIAVDVARQGDDMSVISRRQGLQMFPFIKHRNIDGIQGSGVVSRLWDEWGADACFVDATGGFGFTWIEGLQQLGRAPIPVQYAGRAHNPDRYFNKRTEMAFEFVEMIKRGLAIPDDDKLLNALVSTTYSFKGDKMILEPKEQVKAKLGYSPDEFDSAMQTVAEEVSSASRKIRSPSYNAVRQEYNPFKQDSLGQVNAVSSAYDPYSGR